MATGVLLTGLLAAACSPGAGKQEIPLSGEQTYTLLSSGKATVYPAGVAAPDAMPLHKLLVKRKNEDPAKTPGAWACTDCICNGDSCTCTECSSR